MWGIIDVSISILLNTFHYGAILMPSCLSFHLGVCAPHAINNDIVLAAKVTMMHMEDYDGVGKGEGDMFVCGSDEGGEAISNSNDNSFRRYCGVSVW